MSDIRPAFSNSNAYEYWLFNVEFFSEPKIHSEFQINLGYVEKP